MTPGPDVVQRSTPENLGPISPELALVDHELAERARALLPEPREQPRPLPAVATEATRPRPRRWRRTAALAAVVLVAGAASGGLLARKDRPAPEARLEPQADARTRAPDNEAPKATQTAPQRRAAVRRTWAPNVLGVTAGVNSKGVKLVWQKPRGSDHVVVLRALSSGKQRVVVFRGRATKYRDLSARPCSEYRYTIVNYDRRRHPSTGVPTSVVTPGCV